MLANFLQLTHNQDMKTNNEFKQFKIYKTKWQQLVYKDFFCSVIESSYFWLNTNEKLEYIENESSFLQPDQQFLKSVFYVFDCLIDSFGIQKLIKKGILLKIIKLLLKYYYLNPVKLLKVFKFL